MIPRAGRVVTRNADGKVLGVKPAYNPATAVRIISGMSEHAARRAVRNRLRAKARDKARARAKAKLPGVDGPGRPSSTGSRTKALRH